MILLAEISEQGWANIISAVGGTLTTAVIAVLGFIYTNRRIDAAATRIDATQVATSKATATKIDGVTDVLESQNLNTDAVKEELLRSQQAVKDDLLRSNQVVADSNKSLARKVDRVHSLVNGPHTALVADKAAALRKVADYSGEPADVRAAEDAENDLSVRRAAEAKARFAADGSAETAALKD